MTTGDYPFCLHDGRELTMMLAGEKPLAVFTQPQSDDFTKEDFLSGQDFACAVETGTVIEDCRVYHATEFGCDLVYWFYALPTEEWRIPAYCLLLDLLHHQGTWSSQLEWLQGTLLGYTEEQNRFHLSRKFGSRKDEE